MLRKYKKCLRSLIKQSIRHKTFRLLYYFSFVTSFKFTLKFAREICAITRSPVRSSVIRQFPATSNWRNGKGSDGIPGMRGTTNRSRVSRAMDIFPLANNARYRHIPLLVASLRWQLPSGRFPAPFSLPVCVVSSWLSRCRKIARDLVS